MMAQIPQEVINEPIPNTDMMNLEDKLNVLKGDQKGTLLSL